MRGLGRFKPTPAMVVASIALLVALGGTSWAAMSAIAPPNSVATPSIRNNAVTNPKIANNAVTTTKVRNGSLTKADFASGQIPAGKEGPAGPAGPTGPSGPAGPSDAYSRFLNGPLAVPNSPTTLTSLTIPAAGKYVAWGKAYFTNAGVGASGTVTCQLAGGTDNDQSQTWVGTGFNFTLDTTVVHEFTAAGTFDFKCAYSGTGTTAANFIKITAIKVNNLTNTG